MLIFYLSLSSKNILIVWATIELNIIIFIPLHSKYRINTYNNLIKYFLIQRVSRAIIFIIIITQHRIKISINVINGLINIVLIIKLGLFPFRTWYFQITENIEWKIWLIINTIQKILPIWILTNFINTTLTSFAVITNRIYSSLEITTQRRIRWLLNCSSLNHISWILIRINSYSNNWELYLSIYILISLCVYTILKNFNTKTLLNTFNFKNENKTLFCLNLINFAGIPPIVGFIPKLIIIYCSSSIIVLRLLISNNILIRFYYIKIIKNIINNKILFNLEINNKINFVNLRLLISIILIFLLITIF